MVSPVLLKYFLSRWSASVQIVNMSTLSGTLSQAGNTAISVPMTYQYLSVSCTVRPMCVSLPRKWPVPESEVMFELVLKGKERFYRVSKHEQA